MGIDIFGGVIGTMERALDLRAAKHGAILSNLANMDNPKYKGFDIMVEEEMKKSLKRTDGLALDATQKGHIGLQKSVGAAVMATPQSEQVFGDGRGKAIDRDKVMVDLARNSVMYNASAHIISKKFEGLKQAIQDGR
jgi:flagellar basal-body rod protein FlgB